jgi:outer membrane protein assembly factor BamB
LLIHSFESLFSFLFLFLSHSFDRSLSMSLSAVRTFLLCTILLLLQTPRLVSAADTAAPAQPPGSSDDWTGWGGNVYNNRWNVKNTKLNSTNVDKLVQNCKIDYPGGVAATPVVLNYTAYYPTVNGSFYALNIATCQYQWQINVTAAIYDFQTPSAWTLNYSLPIARTSPQIDGSVLYFGTQALALLMAVDVTTGQHIGTYQVNDHPLAVITVSPTVYDGKLYIGTSSHEDNAPQVPTYKCCSFIGNFASFTFDRTAKKFTKVWEVKTLPEGQGWAGAGVWGSQPSIDPIRKQIFIGTGNLLTYPETYKQCANGPVSCLPENVWQDSIVALDLATGKVNWRESITPLDVWNGACGYPGQPISSSTLCPPAVGPDADFAMAPAFVPASLGDGTTGVDSVVVGQKSGNIFNFNAITGAMAWNTTIGTDNAGGWLSWGVAVDAAKIYFTGINYGLKSWALKPAGPTITNSAWGSLSLKTGDPVWEQQVPDGLLAYAPPGIVNDVVFVGQSGGSTTQIPGAVFALSKDTGAVVYKIPVDGVQNSGTVAKGGFLMFGTGYAFRNPFNTGSFYVYALPGAIADAIADMAAQAAAKASQEAKASASATKTGSAASSPTKKSAATKMSGNVMMTAIYLLSALAFIHF